VYRHEKNGPVRVVVMRLWSIRKVRGERSETGAKSASPDFELAAVRGKRLVALWYLNGTRGEWANAMGSEVRGEKQARWSRHMFTSWVFTPGPHCARSTRVSISLILYPLRLSFFC